MQNKVVTIANAEHYIWREVCHGWRLVAAPELSVIEERMPAGASEQRHYHERARQFFYVLAGILTLEIEGIEHCLQAGEGIEVHPGQKHTAINRDTADVRFLVISQPSTQGDRVASPLH